MFFRKAIKIVVTLLVLALAVFENANASSVGVKCEVRSNTRSRISVNGTGMAGAYSAMVYSPGSGYAAVRSKKILTAVNGEVQFDFDSNPNDINAGATPISPKFIKNLTAYGFLRRISDNLLIASIRTTCQAK